MPRVSVILPIYNADRFVGAAIESILDQGFGDFELLIHDDGSSDGSFALAQGYAERDNRIRLTRGENQGVFATRNAMMADARGEYIAVMDADDIALPDRFEKQVAFLDAHADHVCVGGRQMLIDDDGFRLGPATVPTEHDEIDAANLTGRAAVAHPTTMMRADAVARIGGYDGSYSSAGDLDIWLRLAEVGKLANLPDVVLLYRLTSSGITARKKAAQRANMRRACDSAGARRGIEVQIADAPPGLHSADSADSEFNMIVQRGWLAWKNGFRDTWFHYAGKALRRAPVSRRAWQLALFGLIRRPGQRPRKAQ